MYTERELAEMDAGSLRGIVASLQQDAERYRFLRDHEQLDPAYQLHALKLAFSRYSGNRLDMEIDQAMADFV